MSDGRDAGSTRQQVRDLLAVGLSRSEIARRLDVTKSTVSYHARRLGAPIDERCNRRYDWAEVQRYYDLGHSVTECQAHFGFCRKTFFDAWARGAVRTRRHGMPIDELLAGAGRNRGNIKRRLLAIGIKSAACERCGLTRWRDAAISLQLHHINGDGADNRLENLEILCPNCHAQTDTWGGRNTGRRAA